MELVSEGAAGSVAFARTTRTIRMCSLDARSGDRPCRSLYLKMVKGEEKGDALVTAYFGKVLGGCAQ